MHEPESEPASLTPGSSDARFIWTGKSDAWFIHHLNHKSDDRFTVTPGSLLCLPGCEIVQEGFGAAVGIFAVYR